MITTRKDGLVENLHGIEVPDPYRWLEGDSTDPEIHAWLTAQADAASGYFSSIPIRNTIRDELKKLSEYTSVTTPWVRNGRYFYMRREPNQDMSVLYMREGVAGTERVLIDPNTLSPDKTTVLSGWLPSWDGKRLIYGLSASGNDKRSLYVLNVETGETLQEHIASEVYPAIDAWHPDGSGFWYVRRDPAAPLDEPKFHKRLFFHKIGTDVAEDVCVWGEGFVREWIPSTSVSRDGTYQVGIIFGQEQGEEWCEVYVRSLVNGGDFVLAVKRVPGIECGAVIHRDTLYIVTSDGAPRWKLMSSPVVDVLAGKPQFTDVLSERTEILDTFKLIGNRLFVAYTKDVYSILQEYSLDGTYIRDIPVPGIGTAGSFSGDAEGDELFYSFTSFAYPPTIFREDLKTGQTEVFHKTDATFDTASIVTEQVWCVSKDGTRVPIFLVHKKDLERNGNNPTMLYGYGGFDISLRPTYATDPIPFIMRGGIYAIVNLRGGGEFGRGWHEAGTKKNKQNVFDDFIAAAEFLIAERYTSTEKLAVMGGSNGGLLVAALEVQRPDLVQAVVCRVPVTDMLRFHLHHGGRHWIPDFGSPDDSGMSAYLFGYSPYHNVKDGEKYPATLIMTSDGDDRVHPLHAYKFAARLQEANASLNPILMRVEMKAGHGGAQAISRAVEQSADMWSFVFNQLAVSN